MASEPNGDSTLVWQKSSVSADSGNCVEVARSESYVMVRDSGDQWGATLTFSLDRWHGFIRLVKSGKTPPG
jgi:hypothetical protein